MRNDFEYIPTIPVQIANKKSVQRAEKTMITGAMVTAICLGFLKTALALLGVLTIVNIMQKRKKRLTSRPKQK